MTWLHWSQVEDTKAATAADLKVVFKDFGPVLRVSGSTYLPMALGRPDTLTEPASKGQFTKMRLSGKSQRKLMERFGSYSQMEG
jgi:hypothetical protein